MKGWSDEAVEKAVRENDHVVATDDNGMRIWTWQADDESEPAEKGTTVKQAREMVRPGDHIVVTPRNSKYNNNIVVYHCHKRGVLVFDSIGEFRRYQELLTLEEVGEIDFLELQVPFELLPSFVTPEGESVRAITYRADFTYTDKDYDVIEDFKGMETDVFKLKWKMMQYRYCNEYKLVLVTK